MMSLFGRILGDINKRDQQIKIKQYEIELAYSAFENGNYQAALFYFNKVLSYVNVPSIKTTRQ